MAKKILIIDDEPDILALTAMRLKSAGYEILTAVNSENALTMLKKVRPDLILLDLVLPGMQGDEFCRTVKSDPKLKDIPVVVFTASATRIPEKIIEMYADDYVVKPFDTVELLEKIRNLMEGKK